MRLRVVIPLFALLALPSLAQAEAYPTDACVAKKLQASGRYCSEVLKAWRSGEPDEGDRKLAAARRRLGAAFARADAASLEDGVSCSETTATSSDVADLLDDGAAALADDLGIGDGETCDAYALGHVARACSALLGAEGDHLLERDTDRDRSDLADQQARALHSLTRSLDVASRRCGEPDGDAASEAVTELAGDALLAHVVAPQVSQDWTMIDPPDQVDYAGKTLEPICSRGTPWVFFVKRGTVNKLVMYYQGGGACWNFVTCGTFFPVFKSTTGPGDNPANATTGFANYNNPDNPFKDWNAVFVPYCTGDVHWGDAVVDHELSGQTTTIHHKGYVNAQVAEKWAREHFVLPEQVFVTGSSAGAYGAIVNSLPLQELAYPSTPFAVVGDAGNGVITEDFLENDLAKWGIEQNLPDWIPGLNKPLTELSASDLWTEAARTYPMSRFANYTAAYDGGTGGQIGFYNIMLSGTDLEQWIQWWRPSCEWNASMRDLVQETAAEASNYRYYIGVGSRHTMWGNNKVYTDTTGGVPTIVSWLRAMLDGTPDWTNVECTDCGQLLAGDPRPDPTGQADPATFIAPYVQDPVSTLVERIECSDPQ